MATSSPSRARVDGNHRTAGRSTETKAAFKTTEMIAFVVAVFGR